MNQYISLDELIKSKENNNKNNIYVDQEDEEIIQNSQELYQIIGIKDSNKAYITHVGFGNSRPKVLLKDFFFKGYNCKIISYLLNKKDLEQSIQTKNLKMIAMIILKKDNPVASISIEYKTDDNIIESISSIQKKIETKGKFIVYLKKNNSEEDIILHIFEKYPGNNNMVEKLVKFLTHKEMICIYN